MSTPLESVGSLSGFLFHDQRLCPSILVLSHETTNVSEVGRNNMQTLRYCYEATPGAGVD